MSQHQSIVVDVRDLPLSVDEALREVRHPRAGAVSLFVGTVREHDEGREGVTRLDYSAHPGAVDRVRALVEQVSGRPQVHGVYAVHRVGMLEVGDLAVVCAVAAEHRAEAFDGCRHLIEELKSTVPIWKRQQFEAGEPEWVGL